VLDRVQFLGGWITVFHAGNIGSSSGGNKR
jgi:hypothetical protein